MLNYPQLQSQLQSSPKVWLITGVAGFIGSHLAAKLLSLNQRVIGLDNFSTGKQSNISEILDSLPANQRPNFRLIEGDICNESTCHLACQKADYILHQAALGSVPRSLEDPIQSNASNVTGFLNMLVAARDQKVSRFVYASSSAIYGDSPDLPKIEANTGKPLSPYAVTKAANELYAGVFARAYGLATVGLRYFNVFGPRQDPNGAYAAVIPRWTLSMLQNQPASIYGDGSTSRDFCYVDNVVQANLLAATTQNPKAIGEAFNIALNDCTTLIELFDAIRCRLVIDCSWLKNYRPKFHPFRAGDILHSQADITKAETLLGYSPTHTLEQGLDTTVTWFKQFRKI